MRDTQILPHCRRLRPQVAGVLVCLDGLLGHTELKASSSEIAPTFQVAGFQLDYFIEGCHRHPQIAQVQVRDAFGVPGSDEIWRKRDGAAQMRKRLAILALDTQTLAYHPMQRRQLGFNLQGFAVRLDSFGRPTRLGKRGALICPSRVEFRVNR